MVDDAMEVGLRTIFASYDGSAVSGGITPRVKPRFDTWDHRGHLRAPLGELAERSNLQAWATIFATSNP